MTDTSDDQRPPAVDLFCGAGGVSVGLTRAGYRVIGVDINPQPHYPYEFVLADALTYVIPDGTVLVAASPPCQRYSYGTQRWHPEDYPDLVDPVRQKLKAWASGGADRVWVMENVVGAPLNYTLELCGTMFGLRVVRHRRFESNILIASLPHQHMLCRNAVKKLRYCTVAGHGGEGPASYRAWSDAMGIDWMTKKELAQSIPPAYSEYIGGQIIPLHRRL